MAEDPALYLAGRIRSKYQLSPRATAAELLAICADRGIEVRFSDRLLWPGYYLCGYLPLIVIRTGAPVQVLAHELYHDLVEDNACHGAVYTYPEFAKGAPEADANRFAAILCGEAPGPLRNPYVELEGGPAARPVTGNQLLRRGLAALERRFNRPVPLGPSQARNLMPEEARRILSAIEALMESGSI